MIAMISLVVCLAAQPLVCETVVPDSVHADTGQAPTLFECLGAGGQDVARDWLRDHPGYRLKRIQCSMANDAAHLREQIEGPRA